MEPGRGQRLTEKYARTGHPSIEELVAEQGTKFPADPAELLGDPPGALGGPVDGGIVTHHQLAIGRGVHIELDAGGPGVEGRADGVRRGGGAFPCPALMGVGDDPAIRPWWRVDRIGRSGHGRTVASAPPCWTTSSPNSSPPTDMPSRLPCCSDRPSRSGSRWTSSSGT